jgi:hypothetical protein
MQAFLHYMERRFYILVALLIIGRIWMLLLVDIQFKGDGQGYINVSQYLLANGALPLLSFQARGYSLFLAPFIAIFADAFVFWVHFTQVIMDAIIVFVCIYITSNLLRLCLKDNYMAWTVPAVTFIILQPFTAVHAHSIYPDHVCSFFFFIGALLCLGFMLRHGSGWLLAAGALSLGLSGLIRVDMLPIGGILLGFVLLGSLISKKYQNRRYTRLRSRIQALFLASTLFLAPFFGMLTLQFMSTGQFNYVNPYVKANAGLLYDGYYRWLKTFLFLEKGEFDIFSWGVGIDGWDGYRIRLYPDRAFANRSERHTVAELLHRWQSEEHTVEVNTLNEWQRKIYTKEIDAAFRNLADQRIEDAPLKYYVLLPVARMAHYWINSKGSRLTTELLGVKWYVTKRIDVSILLIRLILVALVIVGLYSALVPGVRPWSDNVKLSGIVCGAIVVLRTGELGFLGMQSPVLSWGGLMEARYVTAIFPFFLGLAVLGYAYLAIKLTGRLAASQQA